MQALNASLMQQCLGRTVSVPVASTSKRSVKVHADSGNPINPDHKPSWKLDKPNRCWSAYWACQPDCCVAPVKSSSASAKVAIRSPAETQLCS